MEGTDQNAIFARLNSRYGNLNGGSGQVPGDMNFRKPAFPNPKEIKGTDQNSIFARLNARYGNLTGASPRDVKCYRPANFGQKKMPGIVHRLDKYRNLANTDQDVAADVQSEKDIIKMCICERPSKALQCGRCYQYFQGRVAAICEKHPSEAFLMDFRQCPYCAASYSMIKESDLTWDEIRQMEDAKLPDDDDF